MSRQNFPCRDRETCRLWKLGRDRVWPRSRGLVLRHSILCHDRVGQDQKFLCRDKVSLCRDRVLSWARFLCRDRIFYVTIEYGQMRGFVLL